MAVKRRRYGAAAGETTARARLPAAALGRAGEASAPPRSASARTAARRRAAEPAPLRLVTRAEALAKLLRATRSSGYVVGIDQATESGVAVVSLESSRCVLSGRARSTVEKQRAIEAISLLPGFSWQSALVALEDHRHLPARKGMSVATVLALGDARGRWHTLLDMQLHPEGRRLLVQPRTWRRVLGTTGAMPRAAWKAQALDWARAVTGRDIKSEDEAEAVCIAHWCAGTGLLLWACSGRGGA